MSDELNIFLGVIAILMLAQSWYIHYMVKDGLARLMLLWGNGLLLSFFVYRITGFILYEVGILDIVGSRTWNQYGVLLLYAIVIGQQQLQRHRAERNEDDKLQKDKKELKKLRK